MRNRLTKLGVLILLLALSGVMLAGCNGGSGGVARAEAPRNLTPQVPEADLQEASRGNVEFALDLYQTVAAQSSGNLIFSPYSMSLAFAMLYAGARGETADQIAATLHYTLPQERLHPAFNALELQLGGLSEPPEQADNDDEVQELTLNIANAVWGQEDFAFDPDYLNVLAENYDAGVRLTDFKANPDAARATINRWVEEETERRIQDIVPPGAITPDTRLVLANAIYFYGHWVSTFDPEFTDDGPFTLADGIQTTVEMMRQGGLSLRYASGEGWQAAALPYQGSGDVSLVILLPGAGNLSSFEASLDAARFEQIVGAMQYTEIATLMLPRFDFETTLDLADLLRSMGMVQPFEMGADFSGITTQEPLLVNAAIHKANITVDEEGTEAAAATIIIAGAGSAAPPEDPIDFIVDRPFLFAIYDHATGTILFLGRVMNPTG